jgi:ribose transport system permease protein
MAQTVIVISGGIDLSVGAMMVLTNCIAARLMLDQDLGTVVLVALLVLVVAMVLSGLIGTVIVVSGVPDIVVTLAASFILAGLALIVLDGPGGGTHPRFQELLVGGFDQPLPAMAWLAGVFLVVWVPFKRSRFGIATYAVGSDRAAAFLSGLNVARSRVVAYVLGGFFSGLAGLVTTAFTGSGEPRASIGATATLTSVAAVVLGGVALLGGSGTLLGPILAAFCLALIAPLMLGLGWDPNYAEVARGVIIIVVVMIGGLLQIPRRLR